MRSKVKNIEFLFLALLGLSCVALLLSILMLMVSMVQSRHVNTGWSSVALIVTLLGFLYSGAFFLWQRRLWLYFLATSKRKIVQLAFILLLGIFPVLHISLDLFLRNTLGIEEPFTEQLTRAMLDILIFPLTGGR